MNNSTQNSGFDINKLKLAGKIHSEVREKTKEYLKPVLSISYLCNTIEQDIQTISKNHGIDTVAQYNNCIAFPTGISINNVAAHYTPRYNEDTEISENDVCKIDYGVHIDGNIIDAAFTINFDSSSIKILEASKNAVDAVIKNIGVDARFSELGKISQEIVESYEITRNGKIKSLKVIDNLFGHNILPWTIHGGKFLAGIEKKDDTQIVEENDLLAVEIFVSDGDGTTVLDIDTKNYSHYMLKPEKKEITIPLYGVKRIDQLTSIIKNNFGTLPFCPRFINKFNKTPKNLDYSFALNRLFYDGYLNSYPPLLETDKYSKVAQFEHTVYVSENSKTILSDSS